VQDIRGNVKNYDPLRLLYRTNLRTTIYRVVAANSDDLFRDTGISSLSPFLEIESIHFPDSFGIDVMHLILEGVVKLMLSLWMGDWSGDKQNDDDSSNDGIDVDYILGVKQWEEIGYFMREARRTVPNIFGCAPHDICKHNAGFKAVEFWAWLVFYSIPLLHSRLPLRYLSHWNNLRLAFSRLYPIIYPRMT
jgi:hypothetical protein